ncbi:MAG: PQQ-binding-like beta-propeller repeat protein [Thermoguttaceae bacterium]
MTVYPKARHGIPGKHYRRLLVEFMRRNLIGSCGGHLAILLAGAGIGACLVGGSGMGPSSAVAADCQFVQFGVPILGRPAGKSDRRIAEDVLPKAPRQAQEHLTLARRKIAEGRYNEAAAELQSILDDHDEDGFLSAEKGLAQHTVRDEARSLLGGMPEPARQWYETRFGSQARIMLDEAAHHDDRSALALIGDRWFPTQAGQEAAILLARDCLDRGRPREAILRLSRLSRSPARGQYEPEVSLLLAFGLSMTGREDQAREALADLKRRLPGARFRLGAREFTTSTAGSETLAWLKQQTHTETPDRRDAENCWTMFRGDATRNSRSVWSGLPVDRRWGLNTVEDSENFRSLQSVQQQARSQGKAQLPVLCPIACGGAVLARTPWRLWALDFETGRKIWEYPWKTASGAEGKTPDRADLLQREGDLLQDRVWLDAAHGQIAADGRRVFFIEVPQTGMNQLRARRGGGGPRGAAARMLPFHMDSPEPPNRLVALDLAGEGRLVWSIGGETGGDEPKLAGAFFLGAPLPEEGRLYVLAEVKGDVLLCGLDAATGRLEWSCVVAHPREGVYQDTERRLAGATPSLADGVIVCPTSAGVVVGVDAAARSILWGYSYRRVDPLASEGEWDSTATIADGRVLVTVIDSDQLFCLDLLTGQEIWSCGVGENLFVACVHQKHAILIGSHEATALRMEDRKTVWWRPLFASLDQGLPSGRGLYTGPFYYLPTTARKILRIDLSTGRIRGEIRTEGILGNLVTAGGRLISQDAERIEQFGPSVDSGKERK